MFGGGSKANNSMFGGGDEEAGGGSIFGNNDNKSTLANVNLPKVGVFQEPNAFEKCFPNLTFKQRLYGFCGCAASGWMLSLIGSFILIGGPTPSNIQAFAVLYAVGNFIALAATGFLLGPKTQCRKMWHPTRRYTTAFYLSMLIIVLAVGAAKQNVGIVIVLLIIQVCAGFWYGMSYVPFGRKMVITFLRSTICKPCAQVYDQITGKQSTFDKITGGGGGGGGGDSK